MAVGALFSGTTVLAAPSCSKEDCPTKCGLSASYVYNGWNFLHVCTMKYCAATKACPPAPVDCVEHLGSCSATCGDGVQTVIIDTPAANGGKSCSLTEQTCNLGACVVYPPKEDCPTACGVATSTVPDGLGGNTECAATEACVVIEPEPTPEPEPVVVQSQSAMGGQFLWQANPQMWIDTQIQFLKARIARLQARLDAILNSK